MVDTIDPDWRQRVGKVFRAEAKQTFGSGHHIQQISIRRIGHQMDNPDQELEIYSRDELYELQSLIEEIVANTAP